MSQSSTLSSCARVAASLLLTTSLFLSGCSSLTSTPTSANAVSVSGNWQVASTATVAVKLPALSGELSGSSAAITGIFHSDSATACVPPSASFALTGSANASNVVTLTGSVAGGTLTLTGTLAADGKSLSNATYNVTGGSCAFASPANASAQQYADITGTYAGTFYDAGSTTVPILTMTAQLTQSPASNTDGNFTLSGTGTLPNNPCFVNTPTIVSSQVSGGSFTFTYNDPVTTNSVAIAGTFTPDGKTLNVTNWTLTGSCGPDTGNGMLVKQ